jgi:hypothetical protein
MTEWVKGDPGVVNSRFSGWLNDSYGQELHKDTGTASPGNGSIQFGRERGDDRAMISLSSYGTDSANLINQGKVGILPGLLNPESASPEQLGSVANQFLGFPNRSVSPEYWNEYVNLLFGYGIPKQHL